MSKKLFQKSQTAIFFNFLEHNLGLIILNLGAI
jgi:hypothetical protein